jgi:site-specific DNA-methyltransferase (adenine-specific)
MADGEMAWTSFDAALRLKTIHRSSQFGQDGDRIHITQKPKKLYKWCFDIRAKYGDRILDTHGGSGSSAICGS